MSSVVAGTLEIATAPRRDIEPEPKPLRVTLIPGETGSEAVLAVARVVEATGVPVSWEFVRTVAGNQHENVEAAAASLERTGLGLKGTSSELGGDFVAALEKRLKLTTVLRPLSIRPEHRVSPAAPPSRFVVFHEGARVLYSGYEYKVAAGIIERVDVTSQNVFLRLASDVFEFADASGCSAVTAVYNLDASSLSGRLFLDCCREVAGRYPEIRYEALRLDECCRGLAAGTWAPEVVVTPARSGSLLSVVAEGVWPGAVRLGPGYLGPHQALFEVSTSEPPSDESDEQEKRTDALAVTWSAFLLTYRAGKMDAAARLDSVLRRIVSVPPMRRGCTGRKFSAVEDVIRALDGCPPESSAEEVTGRS
jgi:isocitrate dehydrogenase (NAD+)